MNPRLLTAIAASLILFGCQQTPQTFTEAERTAVEDEIKAARDAYFDAATNLEADVLASYMDPDFIHLSNDSVADVTPEMLEEAWKTLSHVEMNVAF